MIRIWNDRKLALELADGIISEKQKLLYFLFLNISTIFMMNGFSSEIEPITKIDWISTAISIIITVTGYMICFKSNLDKKEFIVRCVCLGAPISIKSVVIMLAIVIIGAITSIFILGEERATKLGDSDWLWLFMGNATLIFYMGRLNYCISEIQKRNSDEIPS